MKLLNNEELGRIGKLVKKAEEDTDAEIVCVVASQADSYYYIPTLWAALLGLLALPLMVWFKPFWFDINDLMYSQLCVVVVLAMVFRIPWVKYKLVPRVVKRERAKNLARRQFLEQNLHVTRDQLGVLVFVSEAERYVEILTDSGVCAKIETAEWDKVIDNFVRHVAAGKTEEGFAECVESVGALLAERFPATCAKNELSDRLVVL